MRMSTDQILITFMDQSPSWDADSHSASQETPSFYGTQRFITVFTQQPANGPYPEADASSTHRPILFP
jgi:hypothetical protein